MFDSIKTPVRYAWHLKRFLQQPLTPEECRQRIAQQLRSREESFLRLLARGVFSNPRSPYRKLLQHAGFEFGDVTQLARSLPQPPDQVETNLMLRRRLKRNGMVW